MPLAGTQMLGRLCSVLEATLYTPMEYIFERGEMVNEMFFVNKGIVRVVRQADDGEVSRDEMAAHQDTVKKFNNMVEERMGPNR